MSDDNSLSIQPFQMHSGAALSLPETSRICRQSFTPVIFMAGEISSGKTTLIASLHDAFLFGPLGDFTFAGSDTLYAFEERAYESRAKEKGIEPTTPRTRYESGQEYFHLRLKDRSSGDGFQVLFADMSGEFYERALYSQSEVREFEDLKRAQVLLLLVDGSKLASYSTRQTTRANALQFLQRCEEELLLSKHTKLQVLISKWDAVAKENREECLAFIRSRINENTIGRQVDVLPVASRPGIGKKDEKLFGVRDLFPDWVKARPAILVPTSPVESVETFDTAGLNRLREVSR